MIIDSYKYVIASGGSGVPYRTNLLREFIAGNIAGSDGTSIATWTDTSGNTLGNIIQATPGQRPILKTNANGINSLPIVRFVTGSSTYLTGPLINSNNTCSIFAVMRRPGSSAGQRGMAMLAALDTHDYTTTTSLLAQYDGGSSTTFNTYRQGTTNFANVAAYGTPYLHEVIFDGANGTFYGNGTAGGGFPSTGNFNWATYYLGCGFDGSIAGYCNFDFAEILIYSSALNSTNRVIVETYLKSKYNL